MYVVCEEHLDTAIDEFIEAFEEAPDIYKLEDVTFTEWTAPPQCSYCSCRPIYLVV